MEQPVGDRLGVRVAQRRPDQKLAADDGRAEDGIGAGPPELLDVVSHRGGGDDPGSGVEFASGENGEGVGGVVVGGGALLLLVVAVLGFTDPARFSRPWGPRVVHTFAYGGFMFGTIHAAAIGTDIQELIIPLLGPTAVFISYVLCLRVLVQRGMLPGVEVNE